MNTKIENYNVKYKKLAISKSIKITIKGEDELLVTMPLYCSFKRAQEFLTSNFDKIKSVKIKTNPIPKTYKTKFDTLQIVEDDVFKTILKKGRVYFYYPKNLDFNSNKVQKELKIAHKKALKVEAKNYLVQRTEFLAKKYNYTYNKVFLKDQKTRFGSCSFINNINLNINLMKYDFDIIDYVIIHELAHTKIKNHSNVFWDEVRKNCPDYKNLRKKLKKTVI